MSKQQTTGVVIGAIVIAVAFFFIGYAVGHHGSTSKAGAYGRVGMTGGAGFGGAGGAGGMRTRAGGFANGTILSMTSSSITISLQGGGSQTVYFTSTTPVLKSVTGTTSDLQVGDTITATGTPDADGSITATNVTIRPAMPQSSAPMIPAANQ